MKTLLFYLCFLLSFNVSANIIEFVASASPGGPTDTITRKVAQIIQENSDIKPLVLNKPGAAHTIAYNYISNSDKPTFIISTPEITKHAVIDQLDVVRPIGKFTVHIIVNKNSPINGMQDLIDISKNREILFGNSGVSTYSYIGMNKVCSESLKCLSVQYKSAPEGVTAIMGNHIDSYALVSFGAASYLSNDKLKSIHQIRDNSYVITMYSKNVPKSTVDLVRSILIRQIKQSLYTEMTMEKP